MRRIMIVDDEQLIREGLAELIDWKQHGYEVAAQAGDGREALEYLMRHEMDVVLTDIKMPLLDGIEFARQLRRERPHIRIVFVSGYDEFDLVRKALQLGACDYLVKPLQPQLLLEVLARIDRDMERHEITQAEMDHIRMDARQAGRQRAQKILRQLALGSRNITDAELSQLDWEAGRYCSLLLAEVDRYYARYASLHADKLGLIQDRLLESLKADEPDAMVFELGDGRYGLCLYGGADDMERLTTETAKHLCARSYGEDTLSVYVGGYTDDLRRIAQLYRNALLRREERFAPPGQREGPLPADEPDLAQVCDEIVHAVRLGDTALLHSRLLELEKQLAAHGKNSFLYGQVMFGNLFAQATRCVADEGVYISEIFADPMEEYRAIYNSQNLRQAMDGLRRLLGVMADSLSANRSGGARMQIRKAKRYIDNHLGDCGLSLLRVAEEFSMSPGYFSTEFHKQLGYTFTEYLTMARIQRASELLSHSSLHVYEVAQAVGYENTTYFSTLFKRRYGVSPRQYRG